MNINANTELYCVFGNPVKHSLSPVMHNTAFAKMKINAVYLAFTPRSIKAGIESMKALGIRGASITIPFKIEAVKYADSLDPYAEIMGSVNTLSYNDGKITGYNTDGYGALQSLIDHGIKSKNSTFLILGNGGSARAIAHTLISNNGTVIIAGRNSGNISRLTDELSLRYTNIDSILIPQLDADFMKKIDVIINTTPVGMAPDSDRTPIATDLLQPQHTVFDIIYSPSRTRLLQDAKKRGCGVIYGIDMLLNQGARQFEIWTGLQAPFKDMRKALKRALSR